jgi:hypothetical protein
MQIFAGWQQSSISGSKRTKAMQIDDRSSAEGCRAAQSLGNVHREVCQLKPQRRRISVSARSRSVAASIRPRLRTWAHHVGRPARRRRAAGLDPIVFQLCLVSRGKGMGLRPDEPPDARPTRRSAAAGACPREGRAIPSRQLPRMRPRSDRGMSQGGWAAARLGRYSGLLPRSGKRW